MKVTLKNVQANTNQWHYLSLVSECWWKKIILHPACFTVHPAQSACWFFLFCGLVLVNYALPYNWPRCVMFFIIQEKQRYNTYMMTDSKMTDNNGINNNCIMLCITREKNPSNIIFNVKQQVTALSLGSPVASWRSQICMTDRHPSPSDHQGTTAENTTFMSM